MLIRYCSDFHLEGFSGRPDVQEAKFLPHDPRDSDAVLVLAGDICSKMPVVLDFLEHVESRFLKVIYVPGNHEYYGSSIKDWDKTFDQLAKIRLKNTWYPGTRGAAHEVFDGISFVFGTLWADGGRTYSEERAVASAIADFRYISLEDRLFRVSDMQHIHRYQKGCMAYLLSQTTNTTVVVSHHLPSYRLCHPRFGFVHNGGFASTSDHLVNLANYWIHGHTHDTIDTVLGTTRVVANPAGYASEKNKSQYNTYETRFLEV